MMTEMSVWVEAILRRDETAVAADWLLEQPAATVERLLNALRYEVDSRSFVQVWADGTAYSEAYWSEKKSRWVFTEFDSRTCEFLEEWVELVDQGSLDADEGLNQATVAWNLEGVRNYWVVRPEDVTELLEGYEGALAIHRVGTAEGKVLEGDAADAWWERAERV
jgi:hypothetical protein